MLRGLRTVSSTWLGKSIMSVMFGILIISFGIWGIADIFRGFGQSTLAKIGNTEISTEQFRQVFNDRLQQVSRQFGRPLTPDQARAFGLDRQVLQQTIAEAVLDEQARRLGLGATDADVVTMIKSDPTFAGPDGKFDPQRFIYGLRQFGYTEQRYIAEQRQTTLRRQLAGSFIAGLEPSKTQLEALTRFQNEQRIINYVKLGPAQAGTVDAPSQDELAKFFDDHKAMFRAPEYRKVAFLVLSPEEIAKRITISDEDARKVFDQRRAIFDKPELRQILQISFQSADAAKAARERIAGGLSFEDLAKEMKLTNSDMNLGLVDRTALSDKNIADAAFALPLNEVSQPVTGTLATVLMKVTKIDPATTATFESAADKIKKQLAADRARTDFQNLRNQIEDERSGGSSIADTATKAGLTAVTVDLDRSGRTSDGKTVDLPKGIDLISAAFNSDVGVENDPLNAAGVEVWFDVLGVTPSRERPLDEVKDQVITRWKDEQIATRLRTKANDLTEKLNKGADFAAEAKTAGVELGTSPLFTRDVKLNGLPDQVVDTAFRTAKGGAAQAQGAANEFIVFKVTEINTPKVDLTNDLTKQLKDGVTRSMSDEQIAQYVAHLERQIGVRVNDSAFAVATGASSSNQ